MGSTTLLPPSFQKELILLLKKAYKVWYKHTRDTTHNWLARKVQGGRNIANNNKKRTTTPTTLLLGPPESEDVHVMLDRSPLSMFSTPRANLQATPCLSAFVVQSIVV